MTEKVRCLGSKDALARAIVELAYRPFREQATTHGISELAIHDFQELSTALLQMSTRGFFPSIYALWEAALREDPFIRTDAFIRRMFDEDRRRNCNKSETGH